MALSFRRFGQVSYRCVIAGVALWAFSAVAQDGEDVPDVQKTLDSARELSQKLKQLQELAEGSSVPGAEDLKDRIQDLKEQLAKLGIDDGADVAGEDIGEGVNDKDKMMYINKCFALAIETTTLSRPQMQAAIAKMADEGSTLESSLGNDLTKLWFSCIGSATPTELVGIKDGLITEMPEHMVNLARQQDAAETILSQTDPSIWNVAQTIAGIVNSQVQQANQQGLETAAGSGNLPINTGLLALVPLLAVFSFIGYMFMALQKETRAKKDKKSAKKQK